MFRIILRGVFLGTASETKQVWYEMQDLFPEIWTEFVKDLSPSEQKDLILFYDKKLNDSNPDIHFAAAHAFMKYDLSCALLNIDPEFLEKNLEDKKSMLTIARLFTHYSKNKFFIKENEILNNLHKIKHLPLILHHEDTQHGSLFQDNSFSQL